MDAKWAKAFLERLCAELAAGRAAASEPERVGRGPWTKAKAMLPAAGLALGLGACSGAAEQVEAPPTEPAPQVAPAELPPPAEVDEPPVDAYAVPISPDDDEPVDVYGAPDDLEEPWRNQIVPLYADPGPDEFDPNVSGPSIPPESYALYEAPSELVPLYAVPSPDTYDPGMPPESYSLYAAPDDPEGLAPADPGSVAVPAYAAPTPELLTPGDVVAMYAAPVPEPLLEEDPEDEVAE